MSEIVKNEKMMNLWNETWPVGSQVFAVRDAGDVDETRTSGPARMTGTGNVIVPVEGRYGAFALHRIIPLKGQ